MCVCDTPAFWALVGYFSGSIPWGYLVGMLKGVKITELGSGNIGCANVARNLGAGYGLLVGFLDLLKGLAPAALAGILVGADYALLTAMFAVIGAVFSIFLRFRGGKGFATSIGGYLALAGIVGVWEPLVIMLTLWLSTVFLTQMTGLANILTSSTGVPLHFLYTSGVLVPYTVFAWALLVYSHRDNIRLMLGGQLEEQRLSHRGKRSIKMGEI